MCALCHRTLLQFYYIYSFSLTTWTVFQCMKKDLVTSCNSMVHIWMKLLRLWHKWHQNAFSVIQTMQYIFYIVFVHATQEAKAQIFRMKRALFNLSVMAHATHVVQTHSQLVVWLLLLAAVDCQYFFFCQLGVLCGLNFIYHLCMTRLTSFFLRIW